MYHIIIINSKGITVSINAWDDPEVVSAHLIILQEVHPNVEYCIGAEIK